MRRLKKRYYEMTCAREKKDTQMNKTARIELLCVGIRHEKVKNANGNEITASSEKRRRIGKTEKNLFEIVIISTKTCLKLRSLY